jgi:hypothetical protein
MMSSSGMKKAARQEAAALPVSTAGLHVFVAMQDFAIYWNGCTLSFRARTRYSVETALKAALSATDRDLVWES